MHPQPAGQPTTRRLARTPWAMALGARGPVHHARPARPGLRRFLLQPGPEPLRSAGGADRRERAVRHGADQQRPVRPRGPRADLLHRPGRSLQLGGPGRHPAHAGRGQQLGVLGVATGHPAELRPQLGRRSARASPTREPTSPPAVASARVGPDGGLDAAASADARGVDRQLPRRRRPLRRRDHQVHSTTDPKPLLDWLATNKYFVTEAGARLIEDYVRQDKYFVAIRLLSDRSTGEIQPLVMRFLGPGPCVPLKLTSIASIRDLRVNLWVLAENRVVPDNFYELEINQARIDWFNGGRNYEQLLKEAADQAGGQAFITEYAGPTVMLQRPAVPGRAVQPVSGVAAAHDPPGGAERAVQLPPGQHPAGRAAHAHPDARCPPGDGGAGTRLLQPAAVLLEHPAGRGVQAVQRPRPWPPTWKPRWSSRCARPRRCSTSTAS